MNNKLFVGGLSWDTTSEDLFHTFEAFCSVADAKVISDRETGRSRGFGFVEMESDQDCAAAIEALNGRSIDGRDLTVNEARERSPRPAGGGGGGGRGRGGYGGGGGGYGGYRR